jgi:hypothetical protein
MGSSPYAATAFAKGISSTGVRLVRLQKTLVQGLTMLSARAALYILIILGTRWTPSNHTGGVIVTVEIQKFGM